jgi:hypothetical protein
MCTLNLSTNFIRNIPHSQKNSAKFCQCTYIGLRVKFPFFLSSIKVKIFRQILEKYSNINFAKIHPVGTEFYHADVQTDSQTDMTKLVVVFRNFANAPVVRPVTND